VATPGTPWNERVIERHVAQITNLIWFEAIRDRGKWGNSWNAPGSVRPEEALASGVRELVEKFIEPRRRHFYVTQSVTNAARPIGISGRDNVGIPARQASDVRINLAEVRLCPTNQALEYLCLTNSNTLAVDISRWRLEGPVKFVWEAGTVLPARGALYVASDVKALREQFNARRARGRFVVGNYRGQLNEARPIVLKDERDRVVWER
jgi:hypothetical protein